LRSYWNIKNLDLFNIYLYQFKYKNNVLFCCVLKTFTYLKKKYRNLLFKWLNFNVSIFSFTLYFTVKYVFRFIFNYILKYVCILKTTDIIYKRNVWLQFKILYLFHINSFVLACLNNFIIKKIWHLLVTFFKIKSIKLCLKKKNLLIFLGHFFDNNNNNTNIFIFIKNVAYKKILFKPQKLKIQKLIWNLRIIFQHFFNVSLNILIKQNNFLLYKWCQYFKYSSLYLYYKTLSKLLCQFSKKWLKRKNWKKIKLYFLLTNHTLFYKWIWKMFNLNSWNIIFLQIFIKSSNYYLYKKKLEKNLKYCIICKNYIEIKYNKYYKVLIQIM
jgi:hypothetical protein